GASGSGSPSDATPMRRAGCQKVLSPLLLVNENGPHPGCSSASRPPMVTVGYATPLGCATPVPCTDAVAARHGQLSTKATKPLSGVAPWQPMQVTGDGVPLSPRVCCLTWLMVRTGIVVSSPTAKPRSCEASAHSDGLDRHILMSISRLAGFAAQNTIVPAAPTGAMVKWVMLAPPVVPRTVTEIELSTTWLVSGSQIAFGISQ